MQRTIDMNLMKKMAYAITATFLLIHVALFALFSHYGIVPMARFNIFSILFYAAMMLVVRRSLWRTYAIGTYLEVVAHMFFAACVTGWDAGFQITLLGMGTTLYYSEYVGRSMQLKYVISFPFIVLGAAAYIAAFFICSSRPAPYPLPDEVAFWVHISWAVIVFSVVSAYMQILVLLAVNSERMLSRQMTHDRLTGMPNRYHLADHLQGLKEQACLERRWLAMADIDDFKNINDTYGHNCGDYVLQTLADIIREWADGEELCRWGGEEFVLVGKLNEDGSIPLERIERLRRAVQDHRFWYEEHRLSLTITIGCAAYRSGQSTSEWINEADKRLYEGKCTGKNKVVS